MKKLFISIIVIFVVATLYFYLGGGGKETLSRQPTFMKSHKPQVTVKQDYKFSPQEEEQMTPNDASDSQTNINGVEQVFSSSPK